MAGPARYTVSVNPCNPRPRTCPVFQLLLGVCRNCSPASRAILYCPASWRSPPLILLPEKSKPQPAQSGLPNAPNRVLSISEGGHVHRHPSMVGRQGWFRCDGEDQAPRGRSPRATRLRPGVARTWFRPAPGTNRYRPSVGHYTSESEGSHPAPNRGNAEDGFHSFWAKCGLQGGERRWHCPCGVGVSTRFRCGLQGCLDMGNTFFHHRPGRPEQATASGKWRITKSGRLGRAAQRLAGLRDPVP